MEHLELAAAAFEQQPADPESMMAAGAGGWWDQEEGGGDGAWTSEVAADDSGTWGAVQGGPTDSGAWTAEGGASYAAADAAAADSTGYSPAEYLQYLEGEIHRLTASKAQLERQMAAAATAAYREMSAKLEEAGTGVPIPADVPSLVEEQAVLHAVQQYLQYLQELEALTRHLEKTTAALQQQHSAAQGQGSHDGRDAAGLLEAASAAVEAFSHAMGYVIVVRQLTASGQVPSAKLKAHAERVVARVEQSQATLHSLLSQSIQNRLTRCSWPPPLSLGGGGAADKPGAAAAAAAVGIICFEGQGAASDVEALQRLFVILLTLQRAVQHEEFQAMSEPGGEPPLLWAAEELAKGVAASLRHHFAEGLPTDRPDKPEWLFAVTLKAVQQNAPAAAVFQPCIEAHALESWYSMPLEFARAVQSVGLNAILRQSLLPKLAARQAAHNAAEAEDSDSSDGSPRARPGPGDGADSALWLHYADQAMAFEQKFAPLRGRFEAMVGDEEEVAAAAAHPGSAVEILFEEPNWKEAWMSAECWDALRQLDAACDAFNAWQPAQLVLGLPQDSDLLSDTPRARDVVASRQEFWPPACADQVVALTSGLVRRCGWVAGAANRRSFMQAVPLAMLQSFRERLGRQLQVAEGYRAMLSEQWLPSVGAAICAAHYVEHQLREPQGVLLMVELMDADPATGEQAGGSKSSGVAALLEREAAAFGTVRRQWAYKLAKQAVDRFHELFAPYKHDLSVFTAGFEDGVDLVAAAAAAGGGQGAEDEGAAASVGVSPLMLIAADKLLHMLNALAQHLDSVVFRDVWKAVALAVNYAMFNEVATEALFSLQGTRQFDADVGALSAVFGQYTSRPAAHFKETKEACKLLLLPHGQAASVLSALQRQPGAAQEILRPMGIKLLNLDQAATVLMQRLDLIAARQ